MGRGAAELYLVIAPIAAAFAGFGSLAAGLGQRRGGDDARVDAFRLSTMLSSSLSAIFLGLLPAVLGPLIADEVLVVRLSAAAGLIALATYVPVGAWRVRKLWHVGGFSRSGGVANGFCLLGSTAVFACCAAGVGAGVGGERLAGLYLLGLFGLLGSSAVMFSRVIVSLLRPHSEGANGG